MYVGTYEFSIFGMGRLPLNTIATSVLIALLVVKVADVVSDKIFHVDYPARKAFPVLASTQPSESSSHQGAPKAPEPEDITPFLVTADATRGKKVAKKCVQCHVFAKGGAHRLGPNLWNTFGAHIGRIGNYAYSRALKALNTQWTPDALNEYLYKPRAYAPGTKMSFIGLKDPQERADVIAYMNQMRDNPTQLVKKTTP